MTVTLQNSLTRKKEPFTPIHDGKVGIYACGPTVYADASIGNFRTFLFTDLLRRVLTFNGYEVKLVMNITDVGHLTSNEDEGEDRMIIAMKREGKTAWDIATFYTDRFVRDLDRLHILPPNVLCKATDHIPEQIEMIKEIEARGFAYVIRDGVYFDTSKLPDYGKLSGQALEEKEEGARVAINTEKRNPTDFALWKFSPEDEQRDMEWESPWGKGFPGWHIECSAMSEKYLDFPFDIHTGGIDLAPVHHTNEIAQAVGAVGVEPVHVWMHGEFLQVDGGRMGKSLGNAYGIDDIVKRGFDPISFRYFTLNAHYRSVLNFTWESLEASQNALRNIRDEVRNWDTPTKADESYVTRFKEAINDDIDMPRALALLHELVNDTMIETAVKAATVLEFDRVFGLGLADYVAQPLAIPSPVQDLLKQREQARNEHDFAKADALRDQIREAGFSVEDTQDGQRVKEWYG